MALEKKIVGECPVGFFNNNSNEFMAYKSYF
jgi:hypothetical protein